MARATIETLNAIPGLLTELRKIEALTEVKPGIFYVKRMPMLHFHTDDGVTYAHVKAAHLAPHSAAQPAHGGFEQFPIDTTSQRKKLLAALAERCAQWAAKKKDVNNG
jgi:hypothetical protein